MLIPDKPKDEEGRMAVVRSLETDDYLDDVVLNRLLSLARRQSGAPIAYVSLLDADRQRFVARSGLDTVGTTRAEALCAYAILQPDRVLWVEDAREDVRFEANPLVRGGAAYSLLCRRAAHCGRAGGRRLLHRWT